MEYINSQLTYSGGLSAIKIITMGYPTAKPLNVVISTKYKVNK